MNRQTEKFISNFIESQFPLFYQEDGQNFILFAKAYYEWMESEGNPIHEARKLLDYRDIDETTEKFLEHFQKKYLYGIPFNIISNKRFLLKHILDVYRSKGTIQCYRLLFKLLYNDDIEIYLPGKDILKVSDGTWVEPKYLEMTSHPDLKNYIGKTIIGASSRVTATVENLIYENHNSDIISILYISNILPKRKQFELNEKIVLLSDIDNTEKINSGPSILGSLDRLEIINGGPGYTVGDVIKIVYRDLSNNDTISFGVDGILRVTELFSGNGSLSVNLIDGGFGFANDAKTFIYTTTANGSGASFEVGGLTFTQNVSYNTDLLCDYANVQLDATSYNLPKDPSANLTSTLTNALSRTSKIFGTILDFNNVISGEGYDAEANVFVRSVQLSNLLPGTITYNVSSNTVTGVSTIFDTIYQNNDIIALQANTTLSSTIEYAVIKNVVSNTVITLYGPPSKNSTASSGYRAAPTTLPSEYALYEPIMHTLDGSVVGENETIEALPNIGNTIAYKATAINSGKAYVDNEVVKAYIYSCISNTINIDIPGTNYSANDKLIFIGGDPAIAAEAYVQTVDGNGAINSISVVAKGSGYKTVPEIRIASANGFGARLLASLKEFDTGSQITARVKKGAVGRAAGYYSTTRGFLDADKYIQDSYYYQDFSYEIRVSQTLNKYKDIINRTFHTAGSELFGKYLSFQSDASISNVVFESLVNQRTSFYLYASETFFTADSDTIRVSDYYI